jgi:predicted transcriptional regulator
MVRCDEFYAKWQKVQNFCDKAPITARQIDAYLDKVMPLLEREIAESEILEPEKNAIACVLTEGASRPLLSEKDPDVVKAAIKQIVKVSEKKVIDGKKPQVTGREVTNIIKDIKSEQPSACDKTGILTEDRDVQVTGTISAVESPLDQPEPAVMLEGSSDEPVEKSRLGNGNLEEINDLPSENCESANLMSIRSALEHITCPRCGAFGSDNLVWKCCNITLEESLVMAEKKFRECGNGANTSVTARVEKDEAVSHEEGVDHGR